MASFFCFGGVDVAMATLATLATRAECAVHRKA
jgi:hypothetical protein